MLATHSIINKVTEMWFHFRIIEKKSNATFWSPSSWMQRDKETQLNSTLVRQQLPLTASRVSNNNKKKKKKGTSTLACCVPVLSCNIPPARCPLQSLTLCPPPPSPLVGRRSVLVTCAGPGLSCPVFSTRVCGFDSTWSLTPPWLYKQKFSVTVSSQSGAALKEI